MPFGPGGTTTFLRADGTFATPSGGPGGEAFPVGSVFIAVVSTNPATLLGYGTWSAFGAGRVMVGRDAGDTDFDTAEETGGAKTHTLTTSEIPSHTHTQDSHNHTQDAHTHTQNAHTHALTDLRGATTGAATTNFGGITAAADTSSTVTAWVMPSATATNQNATATNQATTATNQSTGGGGAHNNVQPYIVCYFWKRTA
jgi:microcystin-dependent protein